MSRFSVEWRVMPETEEPMQHASRPPHPVAATIARGAALLMALTVTLFAAPGSLDPSFGSSGKVTTDFSTGGGSGDYANAAVGALGFIVAAGQSNAAGSEDFALARYTPNGTLDPTFGVGGKVLTDFSGSSDRAFAAALDGLGRTVLAGRSGDSFALARYLLNGSLDGTFGTAGRVTTSFPSSFIAQANAVAIQSNGKIVAAGLADGNFALARYNSDGSLDTSFGTGGIVTTHIGAPSETGQIHAIAIQTDGKIVAAGVHSPETSTNNFSADFAVARYNTNGSLDATFGLGGVFTQDVSGTITSDYANAVVVLSTGKIVAGGFAAAVDNHAQFALLRLTANGALDVTFGANGQVVTRFGPGYSEISSLAVQTNGQIVAGGYVDNTGQDFAVARYSANGALDQSFGNGGVTTTNFGTSPSGGTTDDWVAALVIQPTGKIVAVGSNARDFALARYNK